MRIRVLFFGQLKDIVGSAEESLDVPSGASLGTVFEHYKATHPRIAGLERSIVLACNHQFASPSTGLSEGDEVALLPPVSGGSDRYTHIIGEPDGHFFALTRERIDESELRERVRRNSDGAIVYFEGVVRNNTNGRPTLRLEYECYQLMAVATMRNIGIELASMYQIGRIAMVHRLGTLEVGEASVAIAVSAPHRKPAFDTAFEAINRLKRFVPIWKKEYFADGAVWVEGEWDSSVLAR